MTGNDEKQQAPAQSAEAQRIAELEAEVARLKGRLDDGASSAESGVVDLGEADASEAALLASVNKKVGVKGVLLAVAIVAAALGLMFGVYSALATGFDAFAKKAATKLVPGAKDKADAQALPEPKSITPQNVGLRNAWKAAEKAKQAAASAPATSLKTRSSLAKPKAVEPAPKPAAKKPAPQPAAKKPGATGPLPKKAAPKKAPILLPGL